MFVSLLHNSFDFCGKLCVSGRVSPGFHLVCTRLMRHKVHSNGGAALAAPGRLASVRRLAAAAAMRTLVFLLLLAVASAKVYQRCELARVLKNQGMDGYQGISLANCEFVGRCCVTS